jgi:hypothetical protein
MITTNDRGNLVYTGNTFQIELFRYTDPDRLNLADSAAVYLGKSDTENVKRPLSIIRQGHALAIFRGESATFKFYDVSKEVYDHLVTYQTMQMRAAGGHRANVVDGFTMPSDRMKNPELVRQKIASSMQNYQDLLDAGETPQVARAAMGVNGHMNGFKLQFNFQTLIESLFVQRIWELGAQGNTVKVVRGMFELCHAVDPELWDTAVEYYGPHTKEWKDVQKKLRKSELTTHQFVKMLQEVSLDISQRPLEEILRETFGQQKTMW